MSLTNWDTKLNSSGHLNARSTYELDQVRLRRHIPRLIRSAVLNNFVELARSVGLA